jgi:hypothetical protein
MFIVLSHEEAIKESKLYLYHIIELFWLMSLIPVYFLSLELDLDLDFIFGEKIHQEY